LRWKQNWDIREVIPLDAIEALKTRRSIRLYEEKPVPREMIEQIIDTARLAPSANNAKDVKHYLEDGSAATENILLAAHALGLGTCWVAGYKKAYGAPIAELLGVPAGFSLVALISLGYPAEKAEPHGKRDLSEVLHWERF